MFSRIIQSILTSLNSLWSNKTRSFITMLGIIIGVSSVVLIMSIGAGAQNFILSRAENLGSNLINVSPGYAEEGDALAGFMNFAITTLKYDDVVYLRDSGKDMPYVLDVAGYSRGFGAVEWRSETYDTSLNGTTASYLVVERGEVETGRFFTKEEEKNLSRVVVLGHAVKDELFRESDAIGQRIKMKDASYEVIGIMKERGMVGPEDYDDQILFPIRTAQRMTGVNHIGLIRARVDFEENVDKSIDDIKVLLREQHNIRDQSGKSDDFSVGSSAKTIGLVTTITDGIRYFLTAMAALSLLVGGIGIMNIMLISVTERTREIGLRKAVGATNFVILEQFLLEAIFITAIGGLIGVVLGVISSFIITLGVQFFGFEWAFIVPLSSIILALVVSASVGLFFGFYPAKKASKLDPIEALRYE
jgi:putative ABC transport system permease protein